MNDIIFNKMNELLNNNVLNNNTNQTYDYQEQKFDNVLDNNSNITNNVETISKISNDEVEIRDMDIPVNKGDEDNSTVDIGNKPKVFYNNVEISSSNLQKLNIYIKDNIPMLSIKFIDPVGSMNNIIQPSDDSKIRIFISARTKLIKDLYIEFKILNMDNKSGTILIDGIININGLYGSYNTAIYGTSLDVLFKISKEFKLGFNSNIVSTNDAMNWISINNKGHEFISSVAKHGYIDDDSHVMACIDFNYNLNYIDLKKELERDINNDLTSTENGFHTNENEDNIDNCVSTVLTNEPMSNNSNLYFSSYKLLNDATEISLENGYSDNIKMYDPSNRDLLIFTNTTFTSDGNNSVIMKSDDTEFLESNVRDIYVGKVNTYNTHLNYNYAPILNKRNFTELFKLKMEVIMPTINLGIYLYQNINVFVKNETIGATGEYNVRLTKKWIVLDIEYFYNNGSLSQKMILGTSEMNMYEEERNQQSEFSQFEYNQEEYGEYDDSNYEEFVIFGDYFSDIDFESINADNISYSGNATPVMETQETDIGVAENDKEFDNRVRALLSTIRYCEGTTQQSGYTSIFNTKGGINSFTKSPDGNYYHPNVRKTFNGTSTSPAGAYQIVYSSWTDSSYSKYMNRLNIKNFNFDNQDKWAMLTIKYKKKAWDDIKQGKIANVINKLKTEWSSFPGGIHQKSGLNINGFMVEFNKHLRNERNNQSILYIQREFTKNI